MNPNTDDQHLELERLIERHWPGTVPQLVPGKCLVVIDYASPKSTDDEKKILAAARTVALRYGNTVITGHFQRICVLQREGE